MFLKKFGIFFNQEIHSGIQPCNFIVQSDSKISPQLSYIPVFKVAERFPLFFLKIDLIYPSFLRNQVHFGYLALNLSSIKPSKSRSDVQFGHRSIHEGETSIRMRPHPHIRKLICHTWAIYVSINFFVLENLTNLIASRMIVPQRLDIVYIVSKNNILTIFVKLADCFDWRNGLVVFGCDSPCLKFGKEQPPTNVYNGTYRIDGNPRPGVLAKDVYVSLCSPYSYISTPGVNPPDQQYRCWLGVTCVHQPRDCS